MVGPTSTRRDERDPGAAALERELVRIAQSVLRAGLDVASLVPLLPSGAQDPAYRRLDDLDDVVRDLRRVIDRLPRDEDLRP